MTTDGSFEINFDSLTAFAEELATQLSGMTQPLGQLTSLTEETVQLGKFGEAHSLRNDHEVAVGEMRVLVGQARDAVEFAKDITKTVSDSYQHYDGRVTGALSAVGGTVAAVTEGVTGLLGGENEKA